MATTIHRKIIHRRVREAVREAPVREREPTPAERKADDDADRDMQDELDGDLSFVDAWWRDEE